MCQNVCCKHDLFIQKLRHIRDKIKLLLTTEPLHRSYFYSLRSSDQLLFDLLFAWSKTVRVSASSPFRLHALCAVYYVMHCSITTRWTGFQAFQKFSNFVVQTSCKIRHFIQNKFGFQLERLSFWICKRKNKLSASLAARISKARWPSLRELVCCLCNLHNVEKNQ